MAASNSRSDFDDPSKKLWRERGEIISSERNVVWSAPLDLRVKRVAVLYYLSRNGQLEHPHFMEVPLSSPRGLFLKDVTDRLDALRGKGMASMYSWSCKRSYKNGFVWHDLSETDLIYPAHGHDYVLKGSELPESQSASGGLQRRNQSCSSIDLEYNVESSSKPVPAADVSTQTDDSIRPPRRTEDGGGDCKELHRAEIEIEVSTPPSDSSPETLGMLMKADGQVRLQPETSVAETAVSNGNHRHHHHHHHHVQRCRSSVLMQLISCGSMPFKDCGAGSGQGLIGGGQHTKLRAPRGGGTAETGGGKVILEEKEYFSGSLVEIKKREFPVLKRSNSYNADRSVNLEIVEKEKMRMKGKCIPTTRSKGHSSSVRKEGPALQN